MLTLFPWPGLFTQGPTRPRTQSARSPAHQPHLSPPGLHAHPLGCTPHLHHSHATRPTCIFPRPHAPPADTLGCMPCMLTLRATCPTCSHPVPHAPPAHTQVLSPCRGATCPTCSSQQRGCMPHLLIPAWAACSTCSHPGPHAQPAHPLG